MYFHAIVALALIAYTHGHGRMTEPPNRASLWRYNYNSPANYDDDGLNCGGYSHQWYTNGGKCGICGDAYNLAQPRPHELGGKYGLGYIVAQYTSGQVFTVIIYLSVSHLGFWELRLCPDPYNNEQECFDEYLLELEDGGTKYYPLDGSKTYAMNYRLPGGLKCEHCVLQWRYTAGNNWGVCNDGTQGLGCGTQEQFFSCSDIAILGNGELNYEPEEDSHDQTSPDDEDTGDSNDVNNEIDDTSEDSDDNVSAESPFVPVIPPILYLNEGILRLLMMGNEISEEQPHRYDRQKYKNKHKRKRSAKKTKRRKYKRIPLYR